MFNLSEGEVGGVVLGLGGCELKVFTPSGGGDRGNEVMGVPRGRWAFGYCRWERGIAILSSWLLYGERKVVRDVVMSLKVVVSDGC